MSQRMSGMLFARRKSRNKHKCAFGTCCVFVVLFCILRFMLRPRPSVSQPRTKQFVLILACTKSAADWSEVRQTTLHSVLLPSLVTTISPADHEKFRVELLVGFDSGDHFWEQQRNRLDVLSGTRLPVNFVRIRRQSFSRVPFNELAQAGLEYGADFFVRVNDDTEFITDSWTSVAVDSLNLFEPPLIGVVGPSCDGGTKRPILTHDMVHKTHLRIFETYYPPELDNWWIDDWMTTVYTPNRSSMLATWEVRHHIKTHGTRYVVNRTQKELLSSLIERGAHEISEFLIPYQTRDNNIRHFDSAALDLFRRGVVEATDGPIVDYVASHMKHL